MNDNDEGIVTRREFIQGISLCVCGASTASLALLGACNKTSDTVSKTVTDEPLDTNPEELEVQPEELKYSIEHIWVHSEADGIARLGITKKLWNLMTNQSNVFFKNVEVVEAGTKLLAGDVFANIETSKVSADLVSPVSGEILQSSTELLRNGNVYGRAWLLLIKTSRPEELDSLLSYAEYLTLIGQT